MRAASWADIFILLGTINRPLRVSMTFPCLFAWCFMLSSAGSVGRGRASQWLVHNASKVAATELKCDDTKTKHMQHQRNAFV